MNKRLVIPIAIVAIVVIGVLSTCLGGDSKVRLKWTPVSAPETVGDSVELKVYVENSGSMDAYMCAGSNLKDAVFDYVSDLMRLTTGCSLYYINTQVIPYAGDLNSFIKDLTPQSFARAGGNRANTNLMAMFDTIVKANTAQTVSVFVSDCILDIPENALDFFGTCQVSVKNTFNEALAANPRLGVEIIKLDSKFEGWWYCGSNREYLKDVRRPYYIWLIGDQRYLAEMNQRVPVADIIGGIKAYSAYAAPQPIPFDIDKHTFVVNHSNHISVELLVNLRGSLQSSRDCQSLSHYQTANPSQTTVSAVDEITDPASKFSHVITLDIDNPATLRSETVTFTYSRLAAWVSESDDTTGANVKDNLDKTTGLMALVKGVAEAYKQATIYGSVTFELKNK